MILFSSVIITQRGIQQISNQVSNGGARGGRVRLTYGMRCQEKCCMGNERIRRDTKALGLGGKESRTERQKGTR